MTDMPDVLARICAVKRTEIAELHRADAAELRRAADRQSPPRGFRSAIAATDGVALIAEVKKASPSAGVIRQDFDPEAIARAYQAGGATCISVLTDAPFFQGSPTYLSRIRREVPLPLLRKDFILDELQVTEARALGADACLLIVAALQPDQLAGLMEACRALGMDALVEVHDEAELGIALDAGADLVGVNNRNLRTFEVDLAVSERLASLVPERVPLVAESGIKTPDDVRRLGECGIAAVLVGETLMRAADIAAATHDLASA